MNDTNILNRSPQQITANILERMDNVDTRPSSVNYQSAAAIAQELRNNLLMIDWAKRESFIGTATGENLDLLAEQFNFFRLPPIKATVKAEIITNNPIPIGNRFASVGLTDSVIYKVVEELPDNKFYLMAEELNEQANYYTGDIVIIDFIPNVKKAEIIEIVNPQKEQETDDEFRERIQKNLIAEATDGNIAQYEKWLSEIEGIGKSKVISLWNGPNTVKCVILNELNQQASTELITKVQNILDPDSQGLGEGLAPIGAKVTVDTAEELKINIELAVEYKKGKTSAPTLRNELNKMMSEIAFNRSVVSYLQVAGVIHNNEDIDFITSLSINGKQTDITLKANQIPTLGTLNVN